MGDVHDIVCELIQFNQYPTNTHPKTRTPRPIGAQFAYTEDQLNEFVHAKDISLVRMDYLATELNLVKTSSARNYKGDRIGYGLSRSVTKHMTPPPPRHLFFFGLQKDTGLYRAREYACQVILLTMLVKEHVCVHICRQSQRWQSEML